MNGQKESPRKSNKAITIVLADDHQAHRSHLRSKLDQEDDLSVVAEADDGLSVIQTVKDLVREKQPPVVIIMDITMPHLNGVEATRQILSVDPSLKILALSIHDNTQFVEALVQAGASGYVRKDDTFTNLLRAIRAVAGGQTSFS